MGAANVIPGVSGGTVAFITGIYERLIHAVKAIDVEAVKLLFGGKWRQFAEKVDLVFIAWLGLGIVLSIVSIASALKFLFANYDTYVWAFFFGLIVASVISVGAKVNRWSPGAIVSLLIGAGIAVGVALMKPGSENDSIPYLLLCGVIAMASMIIPGLSGSFVLLLLGNYQLVMIDSVVALKSGELESLRILVPVGIGAVVGLLLLSRFLAWVFDRHHDTAVSLLTGFVAGSLLVIWPWKKAETVTFQSDGETKEKVVGYDWFLPDLSPGTWVALSLMIGGFVLVWWIERASGDGAPEH